MPIKAVTLDAYGTLLRNESLMLIPQRIVADHRLSVPVEDVWHAWAALYFEATQVTPFRTLRAIESANIARLLHSLGIRASADPYVDLFFEVTTRVEPYPEALAVLDALADIPAAIVSNADHEHVAAWPMVWPVQFVLISEAAQAYKPDPLLFRRAVERLGVAPHEVLHVGDSDVDDVSGAKAAGLQVAWVNRDGRRRRPDVPAPDFEIADLTGLLPLLR